MIRRLWLCTGIVPQAVAFAGVVMLSMADVLMDGVAVVASVPEGLLSRGGGRNLGTIRCFIVLIDTHCDFVVGVAVVPVSWMNFPVWHS